MGITCKPFGKKKGDLDRAAKETEKIKKYIRNFENKRRK